MRFALALVTVAAAALVSTICAADDPPLAAKMQCEKAAGPGRVKCEVEARVPAGARIQWGDVEIVKVAELLAPLKGRVGPRDATAKEAEVWRWGLALVAKERGAGEVTGRVRAVVCRGSAPERCEPLIAPFVTEVRVGAE